MYYTIYMLHLGGGNARRMDGTKQHLVATKQARIILLLLLCFNAFFHRRPRIIANMRTYNLQQPVYILYIHTNYL